MSSYDNKDERFFRLEEPCSDGEVVLQMQLVTWCFKKTIMREGSRKKLLIYNKT